MTCAFRHSGLATIFLGSVTPICVSALAMFTQPFASVPGMTMSAVAAPALVSGAITSVWVGG